MPCDKDYWETTLRLGQCMLKVEPTQPRQPNVQYDATRGVELAAAQELLRRPISPDPPVDGFDQALEGLAHRRIVVDHEYGGFGIAHGTRVWTVGKVK